MSLLSSLKRVKKLKKILILGSGAVGKSSMLKVFKESACLNDMNDTESHYSRTLFLELESFKASQIANTDIEGTFHMYDLAGQIDLPIHATRDIADTVLGSVDLVVLMFANDNTQSLFDIINWMKIIDNYYDNIAIDKPKPKYILINNKIDIPSSTDHSIIDDILKNEKRFVTYFPMSCMNGEGVSNFKEWLISYCFGEDQR